MPRSYTKTIAHTELNSAKTLFFFPLILDIACQLVFGQHRLDENRIEPVNTAGAQHKKENVAHMGHLNGNYSSHNENLADNLRNMSDLKFNQTLPEKENYSKVTTRTCFKRFKY